MNMFIKVILISSIKRFVPKTCFLLLFLVAGEPVGVPVQLWCCGVVTAEVILLFAKVSNIIHHHSPLMSVNSSPSVVLCQLMI